MTRHCILDIETNGLDINKADCKVIGIYDIESKTYMILKYNDANKKKVQEYLKCVDWVITFNGVGFDLPILERHNITIPFYKSIDLYQVCKKRTTIIKQDGFDSFSLRNIVKELKLDDVGKGDIDYHVFEKEEWTEEEKLEIIKYLKQDLLLTFKLWNFLQDRFKDFAEFIPEKDAERYKHITSSAGAFAYKAICKMANVNEEYAQGLEHEKYKGAFVAVPSQEFARGKIVCLDFASLYPFMNIQGNLFSNCTGCTEGCRKSWTGSSILKVEGKYCGVKQGIIEKVLKKIYLQRKEFKKTGDSREYVLKIILNSVYGISGNESFVRLYRPTTASDCTGLGRQCINYAREKLNESGFSVLYSDTDSAYVVVPDNKTIEELKVVTDSITEVLSSQFPFGWKEEFNFKIDEHIKYICFFQDEEGAYKKKMYLYVTEKNKLVVKGLKIIKLDCTELSQRIFNDVLKSKIVTDLNCKFQESYIKNLIREMLTANLELGLKRFNVKEEYSGDSSIQEQIRRMYGSGELKLIKNSKLGAGKAAKYCTLEEAKTLQFEDLDLEVYMKELEPFITRTRTKLMGIGDYIGGI